MTRVSMMGQLSAAIAHQLNQPLAAILGNAEAARKMLGRDHPDLAELKDICDDLSLGRMARDADSSRLQRKPFTSDELIEAIGTALAGRDAAT